MVSLRMVHSRLSYRWREDHLSPSVFWVTGESWSQIKLCFFTSCNYIVWKCLMVVF